MLKPRPLATAMIWASSSAHGAGVGLGVGSASVVPDNLLSLMSVVVSGPKA